MYVCLCNGVTESAIRRAAQAGIRTLGDLAMATGCTSGCGCCVETAEAVLREAISNTAQPARASGFQFGLPCAA